MRLPSIWKREFLVLTCVLSMSGMACKEASVTPPEIPGGGQQLVLDYGQFQSQVDEIFTRRGCDNPSCHGGGIRGTFQLSPADAKDPSFDFAQASLQVDQTQREASALLLKPLAVEAGGVAHAGDSPLSTFASVSDTDYQTILSWILAGELH